MGEKEVYVVMVPGERRLYLRPTRRGKVALTGNIFLAAAFKTRRTAEQEIEAIPAEDRPEGMCVKPASEMFSR